MCFKDMERVLHITYCMMRNKVMWQKISLSSVIAICYVILLSGCTKTKMEADYDYGVETYDNSSTRIINLVPYKHVIVNGDTLTNRKENGIKTKYFREDGILNREWWVPKGIFDERGNANFEVTGNVPGVSGGVSYNPKAKFVVGNEGKNAVDYYTLNPGGGGGQSWVVPIERSTEPSTKPGYFKLRIINLTKKVDPLAILSLTGQVEDLTGPITLTYADGTPVNRSTTGVTTGQRASEYIELPYGTYQFRVLSADGRQIAAASLTENPVGRLMDPGTSSNVSEVYYPLYLTNTPVYTYQPGGIYSIVVSPMQFSYAISLTQRYQAYQNQFKIIEDIPAPVNTDYGRMQVVNTIPGTTVSFQVNGKSLGAALGFGESSDYAVIPSGEYTLRAQGRVGNVDVSLDYTMQAGHNHTVWLWKDIAGEMHFTVQHNDLSGVVKTSTELPGTPGGIVDDASTSRRDPDMMIGLRFANFCMDEPDVSFTFQNGYSPNTLKYVDVGGPGRWTIIHGEEALYHLAPGVLTVDRPMLWLQNVGAFEVLSFRSTTGIKPGVWLSKVQPCTSWSLLANPLLYWGVGRPAPNMEGGIYTIALIGSTSDTASETEKARMIIIKHDK